MNTSKLVALCAIAGTVITVGYHAAHAQGAAACRDQPMMTKALESLRHARGALDHAEHDKGGWRGRAIEETNKAISETERGCAFADTH
jgi:hypothetical protein